MFEKYSRSDIKHENKIRNFFGNALSTSSFYYIKFLKVTNNSRCDGRPKPLASLEKVLLLGPF